MATSIALIKLANYAQKDAMCALMIIFATNANMVGFFLMDLVFMKFNALLNTILTTTTSDVSNALKIVYIVREASV